MRTYIQSIVLFVLIVLSFISCDKDTGLNLFSIQQELELGRTMDSIIHADPIEFPILEPATNPEAYAFMNEMMQRILQSDDFVHKEDFNYKLTIINKDIMNAFAVPGGNLYFYTGLMKYLDNSAELAGVLAHEMSHVDRRHSSEQLSKVYGVTFILTALLGEDKSELEQIALDMATGLAALQFSRSHEYESDEYSIRYMDDTDYYHPKGIAGFFEKLDREGRDGTTFEFLSTHPSDENRLEHMNDVWVSLGSPEGQYFESEYVSFKAILP